MGKKAYTTSYRYSFSRERVMKRIKLLAIVGVLAGIRAMATSETKEVFPKKLTLMQEMVVVLKSLQGQAPKEITFKTTGSNPQTSKDIFQIINMTRKIECILPYHNATSMKGEWKIVFQPCEPLLYERPLSACRQH